MSNTIFRSVCKSYRLLNGLAASGFCRPPMGPRADDMMKFSTGILYHASSKGQHRTQVPSTHNPYITSCLGFHHAPSRPALPNTNSPPLCQPVSPTVLQAVSYSTSHKDKPSQSASSESVSSSATPAEEAPSEEKLSIFQRFKRAYKEHGKILVAVHVATSIVWYGSFYAVARGGVDIVPWMESWGFSETVIKPFRAGGLGDFAVAYLMYKLATPARYTVTLAGTNLVIRNLRSRGKMAPKSQEDSLRELYKEGRQKLKDSKLRQDRLKKIRAARERRKMESERKKK